MSLMNKYINLFTVLVFVYSFVVCMTFKKESKYDITESVLAKEQIETSQKENKANASKIDTKSLLLINPDFKNNEIIFVTNP